MIKLIKNELIKIFSRKGIYITFIVFIAFICLTNYISGNVSQIISNNSYIDEDIKYLESELANINPEVDAEYYVSTKTTLDNLKLQKKYDANSWQVTIVNRETYTLQDEINRARYIYHDEEEASQAEAKLAKIVAKLNSDKWEDFVNDEITETKAIISSLKAEEDITTNKTDLAEISKNIKINENHLESLQYRLDNELPYGDDYLNNALVTKESAYQQLLNFTDVENLKGNAKNEYQEAKKTLAMNEYILQNKEDINAYNTSRSIIMEFYNNYFFLFLIIVVMIAGTIISDEFNKGTIKNLLIKPYTRIKIFFSKYLTAIIMLLLSIVVIALLQLIIGGIFLDFSSLSVPAVVYNYTTESIEIVSLFRHFINITIASLPELIILLTIAFTISTLFNNSAIAIVLTVFTYLGTTIVSEIAVYTDNKILRLIPTLYWDFNSFLYGGTSPYENVTLTLSIAICVVFLIAMLVLATVYFKKENIKNI